eukprot:scaffold1282_cov251-Pinguiococcus_pyrenoidosus.AAC.4
MKIICGGSSLQSEEKQVGASQFSLLLSCLACSGHSIANCRNHASARAASWRSKRTKASPMVASEMKLWVIATVQSRFRTT